MMNFLLQHQFWVAVVLYWVFSAAISAMPVPEANGSLGYTWLYRFLHTTAGNLTTAFGSRIPGIKPFILLLLLPIVFATSACGAHYQVHPGALNQADSVAYDTLLVAEASIQQAEADYQSGQVSPEAKDQINNLVRLYNVARTAWITYREAAAANAPADSYFQQLNQNLIDLTNAIKDFATNEKEVQQ
ncbi:MAG TPA: hypothetical protein VGK48_06480 [Terriglobia bacterium]|jgi:hypothetical protein